MKPHAGRASVVNPSIVGLATLIVLSLALGANNARAYFEWEPVTDADWQVGPSDTLDVRDAVFIFIKTFVDDANLHRKVSVGEAYCRLRILTDAGREHADIVIPYSRENWRISKTLGRTILPDGTIIELDKDDIREDEIYKSDDEKVHAKAFSMKGVTDDCIVEYIVQFRGDEQRSWVIDHPVPVLQGEHVWRFFGGKASKIRHQEVREIIADYQPGYVFRNIEQVKIETRPEGKQARDIVFLWGNLPAFKDEPYTMVDDALQAQFHTYYAQTGYWATQSEAQSGALGKFMNKSKKLREAVFSDVDEDASIDAQVEAVYDWLSTEINNRSYKELHEEKKNDKADQAYKRGYASRAELNKMFCGLLQERGIDARLAWVVDRDEGYFVDEAYYWQFDSSLVLVGGDEGRQRFYSPGNLFMPAGFVPWFCEGAKAYLVGEGEEFEFTYVPFSSSRFSRLRNVATLSLDEDMQLAGTLSRDYMGHPARKLRLALYDESESDREEILRNRVENYFSDCEVTGSPTVDGDADAEGRVKIKGEVEIVDAGRELGDRYLMQPFELFGWVDNPFQSEERLHPVLFDYAFERLDAVTLQAGEGWEVDAVPEAVSFANEVGRVVTAFTAMGSGVSVQYQFVLNQPFWPVDRYDKVCELFTAREELRNMSVMWKRAEMVEGE